MKQGKIICKELKKIRREIADENNIPLEIPECTYEGDCSGTCPQCDAELQYLENEISKRKQLSKAAIMAGVALGLASCKTIVPPVQLTGDVMVPVRGKIADPASIVDTMPDTTNNVDSQNIEIKIEKQEKDEEPIIRGIAPVEINKSE